VTTNLASRFKPPLWAVALYVTILIGMLALGRWQLLRADEKIVLIERAEAARIAEPVDVAGLDAEGADLAATEYRRVFAQGRWLSDRQFLWDNRAHASRAGFEVITPLLLADGRAVLVNRGWQPLAVRREQLPDVSAIAPLDEAGGAPLTGLFSQPSQGFASGVAFVDDAPWPRYLQYFDYTAIERALGHPLIAGVLQPDAAPDDGTEFAEGDGAEPASWRYVSNWQPAASGPQKHYSYAVQWFAMAIALSVIFVVTNLTRRPADAATDAPPIT